MARALEGLPAVSDPRVLVSSTTADDAGVYLLNEDTALLHTIDFFTPMVDDARDFGRVAAANALSDIYAMGGVPLTALSVVCFPSCDMPPEVMTEMLLGGLEKMDEAGVSVLGGHSVDDVELKCGYAVTGVVHPTRMITNAGASPGELLVLTKPIGVGVLSTAVKKEQVAPDVSASATAQMTRLNKWASEAMIEAGAKGATDVTGFGLLGHACEMASASGVTIEIEIEEVPVIDDARKLFGAGIAPGALRSNYRHYGRFVKAESGLKESAVMLLHDPQTSGGLLIALPESGLDAFRHSMADCGDDFWIIGRIGPQGEYPIVLR